VKVGLIAADKAPMPNLALMKLSAWHKNRGDKVYFRWIPPDVDRLYISCLFKENAPQARGIGKLFPTAEVILGGYGINNTMLPHVIEHIYPDYSLYGIDYSMGYTSRGCIRNCPWCVIPKMEGYIREWAWFDEFHRDQKKMVLLDPNILASPRVKEKLQWLIDNKIDVNFNAGLDARLVTDEIAQLLSQVRTYTWSFKTRMYHFAWDNVKDEKTVLRGLERLLAAGIPAYALTFYVLSGYDGQTIEDERYRCEKLISYEVNPFVMLYHRKDPVRNAYARWINKRLYKVCTWDEYERNPEG